MVAQLNKSLQNEVGLFSQLFDQSPWLSRLARNAATQLGV